MTTIPLLRRIGLAALAALFAGGVAMTPLHAVDNDKSKTSSTTAEKKKTTDKKNSSASETGGAQQKGGGAASPMSGYRPDPVSNY
jgi:hypothetical protein